MKEILDKTCRDAKLVGASMVVCKDGKIVESHNYGYSSFENKRLANDRSVYRIASISKVVVALTVLKLYERGLVDLDSDISKYLGFKVFNPHFPDDKITIKMIMTQTSSIKDGCEDEVEGYNTGYNDINGTNKSCELEDLLLQGGKYYTEDTWDIYKPGTKFNYANFNCGILACIVERITGVKFTTFVRQEILLPLGMDASFDVTDILTTDISSLYYPTSDGGVKLARYREDFIKSVYPDFGIGKNFRGPAGGLFTSMQDLSRIMNMLINKGYPLFKEETIKLMLSSHWKGDGDSTYKEKGLQVQINNHFNNRTLKGHFGSAYGARSFMLFNEEKKIGICFITNGGHFCEQENGYADIHEKLINAFLDKYWL